MSTKDKSKIVEKVVKRGNFYFRVYLNSEKKRTYAILLEGPDKIISELRGNSLIRGKAKCNPEDVFDPESGTKMAIDRALERLQLRLQKSMQTKIIRLKNQISSVEYNQQKTLVKKAAKETTEKIMKKRGRPAKTESLPKTETVTIG